MLGQLDSYNSNIERLEVSLSKLTGMERLDTLRALVDLTLLDEKGDYYLNEFQQEALKQNNIRSQAYWYGMKALVLFYEADADSFYLVSKQGEDFARKYKNHTVFFGIKQNVILRHSKDGDFALAAKEAKEMYLEAKELNDYSFMASASAAIGNVYSSLGIPGDAIKHFQESLALLNKTSENLNPLYLNVYRMTIHNYSIKKDSEKTLMYIDSLQRKISEFESSNKLHDLRDYYFYIEYQKANAYLWKNDTKSAYPHIVKADSIYNVHHLMTREYTLNALKGRYYQKKEDIVKSAEYSRKLVDYADETNWESMEIVRQNAIHAHNILELERYKESAELYDKVFEVLGKGYEEQFYTQINQLRILYDLDKMELQAENDRLQIKATQNRLIILSLITLFLVVVIVISIWYMQRIRKKNMELVKRIREQDLKDEKIEKQREELERLQENETLNNNETSLQRDENEILTVRLKAYIKENPIYTNPALNRKELAKILGTNENYLRVAIKEQLGYTINEYINELRISHAKSMLALPQDEYTIEVIAHESGFGTRSTMHRQFKNKYGLSPNEYRSSINKL